MPIDEILKNLAPAIIGLLIAAAGLAFAYFERRSSRRRRREEGTPAPPGPKADGADVAKRLSNCRRFD